MSKQPQDELTSELVNETQRGSLPRRDFLRRVVTLGMSSAAAYAMLNQSEADAGNPVTKDPRFAKTTTRAYGEEGTPAAVQHPPIRKYPAQRPPQMQPGRPVITTQAVGEEGQPPGGPRGRCYPDPVRPIDPPTATTWAIGEESPPPPQATTMMVGEEGSPPTRGIRQTPSGSPRSKSVPNSRLWKDFLRW